MSGLLVDIIGGPLDGQERHRQLSTGGAEEIVADAGNGEVHVWMAASRPDAPYTYRGRRRATKYDGACCVTWGVGPLLDAMRWWWRLGQRARALGLLRALPAAVAWSLRHGGVRATWNRPEYMIPSYRVRPLRTKREEA